MASVALRDDYLTLDLLYNLFILILYSVSYIITLGNWDVMSESIIGHYYNPGVDTMMLRRREAARRMRSWHEPLEDERQ
jgi:hypothetical protein